MATLLLKGDTDQDFMLAANYDPAQVPANGDTIRCPKGPWVLTNNVASGDHSLSHVIWEIGDEFSGQLGTTGTPFSFTGASGDCSILYDAPKCQGFFINSDIDLLRVIRTLNADDVLRIMGGTVAHTAIVGGVGLLLTSGGTFTRVTVAGPTARPVIENGNTVNELRVLDGECICNTLASKIEVGNGTCRVRGVSKTYPLISCYDSRGVVVLECGKSTITSLRGYAGFIDGRKGENTITVSGGELWPGCAMHFGRHVADGANITRYGGTYKGYGTPVQSIPGLPQ